MIEQFRAAQPSFTFPEFLAFCENLVAEGRTSGPDQSEFLQHFTKLNLQRMKRWYQTVELTESTRAAARNAAPQEWYVITEAWCGDSAQNLPVVARIAEASEGKIKLRIVLREESPELMNAYLTNGSKSIPKLVAFDGESGHEIFVWGPRPQGADALFKAWKEAPEGRDFEAFEKELHTWYAKTKGLETQSEIEKLIQR